MNTLARLILITAIVLLCIQNMLAQSTTRNGWSIESMTGIGKSKITFSEKSYFTHADLEYKTSIVLGGSIVYRSPSKATAQLGVFYMNKGFETDSLNISPYALLDRYVYSKFDYASIYVPIMVGYSFPLTSKGTIRLMGGIMLGKSFNPNYEESRERVPRIDYDRFNAAYKLEGSFIFHFTEQLGLVFTTNYFADSKNMLINNDRPEMRNKALFYTLGLSMKIK